MLRERLDQIPAANLGRSVRDRARTFSHSTTAGRFVILSRYRAKRERRAQ
jgi:hypothetical protein